MKFVVEIEPFFVEDYVRRSLESEVLAGARLTVDRHL
jgi:hypothetical protein